MLKALMVAAGISLIALSAVAQTAGPQIDPEQLAQDPDKAASLMAAGAFMFGCLEPARFATSAAAYAANADELAVGIKAKLPEGRDYPFALEGVGGKACRVTYHGAHADALWQAFVRLFDITKQPSCEIGPVAPPRMIATCAATTKNPSYTLEGDHNGDRVSLSLTWLGPKTS